MNLVTLDGLEHFALPYAPRWDAPLSVTFRFEAERVESLTKREARRALGETLRVVDFTLDYLLGASPAAEFRSGLRVLAEDDGEKLVRIPFWPALAAHTGFSSRWHTSYTDVRGDTRLVGAVDDVVFGLGGLGVPTLLGYLSDTPDFRMMTPLLAGGRVRFKESSPATEALVPEEQVWTVGPTVGARTPKLFPFSGDWSQEQSAGAIQVEVTRKQLGQGREAGSQAYPQIGRRAPVFAFTLIEDQCARLLRFFLDRQGTTEAFWLPGWFSEVGLAVDTDAGSADIVVTNADLIADHSFLAFQPARGAIITRKINSRAGATLTLDASPGTLAAGQTTLMSLALVRFASNEMTVKFAGPVATASIGFVEVPQEYATPLGETMGTTIGALPAEAVLVQITHGAEVLRLTSYEKTLTDGVHDWTPRQIEAGEIVDGDAFDALDSQLTFRHFAGSPVSRLLNGTLLERVEVLVKTCVPATPVTNVQTLFRGWLTRPKRSGAFWTVGLTSFGKLFDKKIPASTMQKPDNFPLFKTAFDGGNDLDQADWTFTGDVTAVAGRVLTIENLTWPGGGLPAIAANYFALGRAQRPAPDLARVVILSSTAESGGGLTITLAEEIIGIVPDEIGWTFLPGYDGQFATADDKFANAENFGAFPQMPDRTPTLTPLKKTASGNSKK